MARRVAAVVSFDLPEGATRADAKEYIFEAISMYRGSLKPPFIQHNGIIVGDPDDPDGDPMFGMDPDTIRVRDRWRNK